MSVQKNRWLMWAAVGAVAAWGAGCAHAQKNETVQAPAPAPAVATPAPQPKQTSTEDLSRREEQDLADLLKGTVVHFDFDRAVLTSDSQQRLDKLADALRAHTDARIRIAGNCDEAGTEEYNLALGQRRAAVAKKYLVDLGIDSGRIDTVSYGEERPVDPRHTPEAWSANRRDEFSSLR